jgi:hypothetical protein
MERLAAHVLAERSRHHLRLSIFERSGRFGAGEVHSDVQPFTSLMNRIVAQIALGADESNSDAAVLLPETLRMDFAQWLAGNQNAGSEGHRLGLRDAPQRRVHGLALRAAFEHYVRLLVSSGAQVDRYAATVTDVTAGRAGYSVHADDGTVVTADRILFVTGHSENLPSPGGIEGSGYIRNPYPLDRRVESASIGPQSTVAIRGLGLTAIDVMLYLTEGRGGRFVPAGNDSAGCARLIYVPSGKEPRRLIGFSPGGLFTTARPDNYKSCFADAEHVARFFTIEAVRTLRRTCGVRCELSRGREQWQLDFTRHIFPLIVLEMAFVYYTTLFGKRFGEHVESQAQARYRAFLNGTGQDARDPIDFLLGPVTTCFEEAAASIEQIWRGNGSSAGLCDPWRVLESFTHVLYGGSLPGSESRSEAECLERLRNELSPWGHSLHVYDYRFDWRSIFDPLGRRAASTPAAWRQQALELMRRDNANAEQGNLANPVKAACDGVWRDLRGVLCEVLDFGGLLPGSHAHYLGTYHRYYNRLSNGACLPTMKKLLALVECRLVDISCGPQATVCKAPSGLGFEIQGAVTGARVTADVLIDARVHEFDAARDAGSLYRNLLRRGLVSRFRNPAGDSGMDFLPGGLDLCDRFHPIRADGTSDPALTFLGAPAEGIRSFQTSAARPRSNSYIINVVARWADEVCQEIRSRDGERLPIASGSV